MPLTVLCFSAQLIDDPLLPLVQSLLLDEKVSKVRRQRGLISSVNSSVHVCVLGFRLLLDHNLLARVDEVWIADAVNCGQTLVSCAKGGRDSR